MSPESRSREEAMLRSSLEFAIPDIAGLITASGMAADEFTKPAQVGLLAVLEEKGLLYFVDYSDTVLIRWEEIVAMRIKRKRIGHRVTFRAKGVTAMFRVDSGHLAGEIERAWKAYR